MTTPFPLLRLPYLVLFPILKQLEFMERIALSVLSKQARMYVKLLKMKCKHINLKLNGDRINMTVVFDNRRDEYVKINIDEHQPVDLKYRPDYTQWWHDVPAPIHYALPIIDVTHCKLIKQLTIDRVYEYDPSPLFAKLPKIDELIVLSIEDCFRGRELLQRRRRLQKILRTVLPLSSAVTISSYVLELKDLREIIRGNFESVTMRKYSVDYMSLNDLKMTNVKSLELAGPAFKIENLNRYFKLWMKKKCNPRLEYLEIETHEYRIIDKDLLLDGLNAVQMPIRTNRAFWVLGNVKKFIPKTSYEKITWEFDITRADGRLATIRISNYGNVCFYVWPESANDTPYIEPNQSSFMSKFSWLSTFHNSCIEHFK